VEGAGMSAFTRRQLTFIMLMVTLMISLPDPPDQIQDIYSQD
jgi:hypothetical protein